MQNLVKSAYGGKSKKAFTLIELLIVIAIIGILATVIFLSLNSAKKKAQDSQVKSDISSMAQALEVVKIERDLAITGWFAVTYDTATVSTTDDRNIARWTDNENPALGKRLISQLPKNNVQGNGLYFIRINNEGSYSIFGKLNNGKYACNQNGQLKSPDPTAVDDTDAQGKCPII